MGRPPKTLIEHLQDGTFRPSRHGELLEASPLPPELAHFGERYRAAASARERQAVALELRDAASEEREDDDEDALEAILNAPAEPYTPEKDRAASERAARVLYARDALRPPLSVSEIAGRLSVSVSTVRRYLREVAERERLDELEATAPAWEFGGDPC